MPKTFTDDVNAALPSSIEGPFQVVDPADHDSWIKLDPAAAHVTAAGDARPTRRIVRPQVRTQGFTYSVTIGSAFVARRLTAGATSGLLYAPFPIPPDMDVSAPSKLKLIVVPFANATTNGQVVRWTLTSTHFKEGEAENDATLDFDWPVPDDWTTTDPRDLMIDNGNGVTFDGGTFEAGDHLGVQLVRSGGAAEDTFDKDTTIAEAIAFEYTAKLI